MNPDKIAATVFDPNDPAYRWKLWIRRDSDQGYFRHVFWRRVGVMLAVVCLAGWLALTAGVWATVRYLRGIPEPQYVDVAVPWRWARYRAAMGSHYLSLGRLALQYGHPSTALNYLSAALTMDPASRESRRLSALAQYQLGSKVAALALLRASAASAVDAGDQVYLQTLFDVAFDLQADDEAFRVGQKLLPSMPDNLRSHRFVAFQIATARFNRGHYLEAEQILADWRLQDEPEGEILFADCEAGRGRYEEAVRRLEGDLTRFSQRDGIYVALERLAHDQGLPQAVRRYALLRGIADPARPKARIDLLYADHALDRGADVRREIDSYCVDFSSNADALMMLAQFAIDSGEPDTAARARDLARGGGTDTAGFALAVAQAGIVARDYRRAAREIALAQTEIESGGRAYKTFSAGIKAVALFGSRDSNASLAFLNFLPNSAALSPREGLFLVQQLSRAGVAEQSRELLERVCAEYPDDRTILAELIRSDAAAHNRAGLVVSLPLLLKTRRPPRDALEASLLWLDPAKDAELRAQVERALQNSPPARS